MWFTSIARRVPIYVFTSYSQPKGGSMDLVRSDGGNFVRKTVACVSAMTLAWAMLLPSGASAQEREEPLRKIAPRHEARSLWIQISPMRIQHKAWSCAISILISSPRKRIFAIA